MSLSKVETQTNARTVAMMALMGAALVAAPLGVAHAAASDAPMQVATGAPMQIAQNVTVAANTASSKSQSAKDATSNKPETVEERITSLHAELKITPDEETNWNAVAQAMRENASAMEKLIAEKKSEAPQSMTAVEDLKSYSEFAQAHVDGLKNLTASFSTLYDAMPDQQKKLADQVFRNYGPGHRSAHNSSRKQG